MPPKKRRSKRSSPPWQASARLGLVLSILLGVNFYFFFVRGGTSLRALLKTTELSKQSVAPPAAPGLGARPAAAPRPKGDGAGEDARLVEGTMQDTDTVEGVWKKDGLSPGLIAELGDALGRLFDLRTVRAGQSYTLRFDAEDHLHSVEYRVSPALMYHLSHDAAGVWRAEKEEKPLEVRLAAVGGTIGSSLYDAIKRAGESPALVGWFVDTFAWDINFFTDCNAGDRYRMVVEKKYLGGKFFKYGRILAAEYQGRVGTFRAFWFDPAGEAGTGGNYYTEKGESVVKSLLKTPLKFVRISSGFDRHRLHPILHTERAHLGVDYAAPVGTPVWATANGRVSFVGPRAGGGNEVIIDHANGLSSTYMHLSRFARGLGAGQRVRQKQVIGYVGMTGLATGPHLHYGLRLNGASIDPLKLRAQREEPIADKERQPFAEVVADRLERMATIAGSATADQPLLSGVTPAP